MTLEEMREQIEAARKTGIAQLIVAAAEAHGISQAFGLAISSRESDMKNVVGDNGHAIGPMQIDVRFWVEAKLAQSDGSWKKHPEKLINLGCKILEENVLWAAQLRPGYTAEQHLKIAAAAYNAGHGGAHRGVIAGDCDRYTTGADYGADVLSRMALLTQLGV